MQEAVVAFQSFLEHNLFALARKAPRIHGRGLRKPKLVTLHQAGLTGPGLQRQTVRDLRCQRMPELEKKGDQNTGIKTRSHEIRDEKKRLGIQNII